MRQKSKLFYIIQLVLCLGLLASRAVAAVGGPLGRYTDGLFLALAGIAAYSLWKRIPMQRLPFVIRIMDYTLLVILGTYGLMVILNGIIFRNVSF